MLFVEGAHPINALAHPRKTGGSPKKEEKEKSSRMTRDDSRSRSLRNETLDASASMKSGMSSGLPPGRKRPTELGCPPVHPVENKDNVSGCRGGSRNNTCGNEARYLKGV